MDAYIFQAAFWCAPCAEQWIGDHGGQRARPALVDSARWPDGPYDDGGGEADCPQHCDQCGDFLDNPLTEDGERYVIAAIQSGESGRADGDYESVLEVWRSAYDYLFQRPPADADIGGDDPSIYDDPLLE